MVQPEAQLLSDGEALAANAVGAIEAGLASFFGSAETEVPTISADLVPAVAAALENLAPAGLQQTAREILGVVDPMAIVAIGPLDVYAVSGLKLLWANAKAALSHLSAPILPNENVTNEPIR